MSSETDPFTGLPMDLVDDHNEAMAAAMPRSRPDRFEEQVSNLGRSLGNWNDQMYGRNPERWNRRTWRAIDRIAGWLHVFGARLTPHYRTDRGRGER